MSQSTREFWKTSEIRQLRMLYAITPNKVLAQMLQRSECSVFSKANALGLHKSEEFLRSPASGRLDGTTGLATRFRRVAQKVSKDAGQ